jgi:fructokinase
MAGEPVRSATLAAAKFAKENGVLVSFDPNYRPLLWQSKAEAQSAIKEALQYVDILKGSDEELELMTGTADLENGADSLFNQGILVIYVTLGAKGCFFYGLSGFGSVPSFSVNAIDTTEAGDAFWGNGAVSLMR